MRTIEDFAMLAPMKYYDNPEPDINSTAYSKRLAMINNLNKCFVATEKHDGDWGMFIHYSKGRNLIRSRSISKVTGVYGDYTPKVPHLVEEMDRWPDNTVLIGELCFDEYGTNANTVGTILRCLPEKAIERQKKVPLYAYCFDILMLDGKDLSDVDYENRLIELRHMSYKNIKYFKMTEVFYDEFAEAAEKVIAKGGEGVVIQQRANKYLSGTRTAWATLKLKQTMPHMELKVIDLLEPNKTYEGACPEIWEYWEYVIKDPEGVLHTLISVDGKVDDPNVIEQSPITKPYAMGWKNGIVVDYNGVKVSVTSGLTDEDREWLASDEAEIVLKSGTLYAEIKAMMENDKGSLRHPALVRLRTDRLED